MSFKPGIVVISGGSAANSLVDVFDTVSKAKSSQLSYVIPTSDNGGSSSEIIRVFGGPGIGDVRSRLVRLIPSEPPTPERTAIRDLFNHRLPPSCRPARLEWLDIVESRSLLWRDISFPKRELIRSYLSLLNHEIIKRARPPHNTFNFQSASVGNMFLTGARLFCGSFEAAIYLLSSITGVPEGVDVLPAVKSEFSHHISAGLDDGTVVVGQNAISHPGAPTALQDASVSNSTSTNTSPFTTDSELDETDLIEDATLPGSHPSLRQQNISFSKDVEQDLPSRISRIWYINPYGQEMRPLANPRVLDALRSSRVLIYSIGSLYTSILPCLILRGVGDAIVSSNIRFKILILNGSLDRETRSSKTDYTALDFVGAIARAGAESRGFFGQAPDRHEWKRYVTHVVHLEGEGAPKVDAAELRRLRIECLRVYGRRDGKGMRYDGTALAQALEAILGRSNADKGRRMTLEA
ncbi:MAG: hypothetical protein M1833_006862 [Piccolia ochrophora]|nr:MAG: hypothetical protein M1833_006862 [Piccolia ochrophora]